MAYRYFIIFICFILSTSTINSQECFFHLLDTTIESDLCVTKWNVEKEQAFENGQHYIEETIDSFGRVIQLEFYYGADNTGHLFDAPERILVDYLNSTTICMRQVLHQTSSIEAEAEQSFLYPELIVSLSDNETASIKTEYYFDSTRCLYYLTEVKKHNPEFSSLIVEAIGFYKNNLIENYENVSINEIPYLNYSYYRFGKKD